MGKFSPYLLISDYDSTLTGRDGTVPQSNLEAISYFTAHGGIFTVATGRSLPTARQRLASVPVNGPILAYNGAVCCQKDGSGLLFCHGLPATFAQLMGRYLQQHPRLVAEVQGLHCHWSPGLSRRRLEWLVGEGAVLRTGQDPLPQPAVNFALYAPDEDPYRLPWESEDAALLERIGHEINRLPDYEAVHSAPGMLEVSAAGVNKGAAARELARLLERPALICVGDAPNDLPMLETADLAYVPTGSHPTMEAAGYPLSASCDDGAIADVIARL